MGKAAWQGTTVATGGATAQLPAAAATCDWEREGAVREHRVFVEDSFTFRVS